MSDPAPSVPSLTLVLEVFRCLSGHPRRLHVGRRRRPRAARGAPRPRPLSSLWPLARRLVPRRLHCSDPFCPVPSPDDAGRPRRETTATTRQRGSVAQAYRATNRLWVGPAAASRRRGGGLGRRGAERRRYTIATMQPDTCAVVSRGPALARLVPHTYYWFRYGSTTWCLVPCCMAAQRARWHGSSEAYLQQVVVINDAVRLRQADSMYILPELQVNNTLII